MTDRDDYKRLADYFAEAPDGHASVAINVPEQRALVVAALRAASVKAGDEVMRALEPFAALVPSAFDHSYPDDAEIVLVCNGEPHAYLRNIDFRRAAAALSTTAPQPDNGARGNVVAMRDERHLKAWKDLQALWLALDGGPKPRCRDCADFDGRCQGNGLPCDPQERALEQIKQLRALNQSDWRTDEAKAREKVRQPVGAQAGEAYPNLGVDSAPRDEPQIGNQAGVGSERSSQSDTAPAEPVAWRTRLTTDGYEPSDWSYYNSKPSRHRRYECQPLYAHPPRSVDMEAIKQALIAAKCDTGDGTYIHCSMDQVARSIARMIEGE